jgi:hypothetical protein
MAQATEGIPANHLTAKDAAAQIVALINSKPVSPWPDEIEAITVRVVPAPVSTSLPPNVVAYRSKTQEFYRHARDVLGPMAGDAPEMLAMEEYNAALGRQADVAGDVLLNTPPSTWGDLIGLASIVAHEAGHDLEALGSRRTNDGNPGPKAAEMLALAVLRFHASAVPQLVPVDFELVRLISAWREQRDIIDGTCVAGEGCGRSYEESKHAQAIVSEASSAACDLAKQIWERAKAETWSGGPVNPLTLAALAEIVLHHELGASNTLIDAGEFYMDQRACAELMVAVLSFARSAGAGSDLLPMEGRFLPPALLKGGRSNG